MTVIRLRLPPNPCAISHRMVDLRRCLIAGVAVACGAVAGVAVGEPGGGEQAASDSKVAEMRQAAEARWVAFDGLVKDARDKAQAGELKADVPAAEAERILGNLLHPAIDPERATLQEAEAIELTEKLREAGDLPPLDAALAGSSE